jgi:hypothetical protein
MCQDLPQKCYTSLNMPRANTPAIDKMSMTKKSFFISPFQPQLWPPPQPQPFWLEWPQSLSQCSHLPAFHFIKIL